MLVTLLPVTGVLLINLSIAAKESVPAAEVRITHKYLSPLCLDGVPIKPGERSWRAGVGTHSLAFTMQNEPRQGAEPHQRVDPKGAPGVASVWFSLEAGHKYEVEVRASPIAFSSRVWERGEWKPVVRDRTADRVVSGEPTWTDSACEQERKGAARQPDAPDERAGIETARSQVIRGDGPR